MVICTIAILTAVAVNMAYDSRVSLQVAANGRDELRAYYLAKSAVNLSRLVLHLQHQVDQMGGGLGNITSMLGQLDPGIASMLQSATTSGAAAGALGGLAGGANPLSALSGGLNLRLWEVIPIDSNMAQMFLAASSEPKDPSAPDPHAPPPGQPPRERKTSEADFLPADADTPRGFGGFSGSFHATVADEDRKINVTQFNGLGMQPATQVARFLQMVKDPKYDFLFTEDDANGSRVSREEVMLGMKDWVDDDEATTNFSPDPLNPFTPGFGDENTLYDRYTPSYHAKNSRFDSLDELYQVGGVSDAFMAAFGDKLSTYLDVNARTNINTTDPVEMYNNIIAMADTRPGVPQPALSDPMLITKVMEQVQLGKLLSFMSVSVQQFAAILQANGIKVKTECAGQNSDQRCPFSEHSQTFTIHAVGTAGDVQKTLDVVVTMDPLRAGPLADDMGRILHWHEE